MNETERDREDMFAGADIAKSITATMDTAAYEGHDLRLVWIGFYSHIIGVTAKHMGPPGYLMVSEVLSKCAGDYLSLSRGDSNETH